ncbi:serine/threonine-protein kinase Nek6-like [Paramacrobiotus metropolitanus]|uniref:serine/threonine-protein kinase Nek6-like n=1 Tax=Paramacrobiotus metropolitanus TaxID=2943436 RepID=UPI002445A7E0|nr:serine/threonine-protein kinase Nek6-like [Paramacrobiotus metropolitanus]
MTSKPELNLKKYIGSGAYGKVYEAEVKWEQNDHAEGTYAVKEIELDDGSQKKDIHTGISILLILQHPNLIRYHCHCFLEATELHKEKFRLVMEFCPGENLRNYLERNDACYMLMLQYTNQLCHAVNYLHTQRIIHTDIKSENIFLTDIHVSGLFRTVKLGDLDDPVYKKEDETSVNDMRSHRGTHWYWSPEMARKAFDPKIKVGSATDWWSVGCVLYEMAFGFESFLYKNTSMNEELCRKKEIATVPRFVNFINNGGRLDIPSCCNHIKRALDRCFLEDPTAHSAAVEGKLLFGGAKDLQDILFTAATPALNGCTKHQAFLEGYKKLLEHVEVDNKRKLLSVKHFAADIPINSPPKEGEVTDQGVSVVKFKDALSTVMVWSGKLWKLSKFMPTHSQLSVPKFCQILTTD